MLRREHYPSKRACCSDLLFLATVVRPSFIVSKAAACAMYMHLTEDHLPIDHYCKGKTNAILVAELALATQDFDIIQDLRILNGRSHNKNFDVFWNELKSLLEVHALVDDRRHCKLHTFNFIVILFDFLYTISMNEIMYHIMRLYAGDACFLPVAMYVRDLRDQLVEILTNKHPEGLDTAGVLIPSDSWVAYQFSPTHPCHAASMQYTGALSIKHKVQSRTLRATQSDSHYVACIFKMMNQLGVVAAHIIQKFTEDDEEPAPVVFYSMDDKAKIHVGEPHLAVGFGGRVRRSILPTNVKAIAGDHDFKIVSLTPSATLRVDVKPDEGEDRTSFYRGVLIILFSGLL
jgi:hypothetical protein